MVVVEVSRQEVPQSAVSSLMKSDATLGFGSSRRYEAIRSEAAIREARCSPNSTPLFLPSPVKARPDLGDVLASERVSTSSPHQLPRSADGKGFGSLASAEASVH